MRTIKIFLASSNELQDDRKALRAFLSVENDRLQQQGIYLELVQWEFFFDAIAATRLQDEYNTALAGCDVVLSLFFSKAGQYTQEEFKIAWQQFKATGKPLIYTYFKNGQINMNNIDRQQMNHFLDFKDWLAEIGHFPTAYESIGDLKYYFKLQLEILLDQFSIPTATQQKLTPKHLTPPPFQTDVFLGREEELHTIHTQLSNGDNLLLLVNGHGGIGKTTLASKYYQRYQDKYAHTAWIFSETSIANALLTALEKPLGLAFTPTQSRAERFEQLLMAMAGLAKPCLLVIDNANDDKDLHDNYLHLRRFSNFQVLLTTRITEFEQAPSYAISGLPEAEALQLFKQHYPKLQDQELDLFKQIRMAVGGNTLVLELLAKNLLLQNRLRTHYSLAALLLDLQTKGLLALSKSQAVTTGYQATSALRQEKPEAIICGHV